jgi:hypothetical protein
MERNILRFAVTRLYTPIARHGVLIKDHGSTSAIHVQYSPVGRPLKLWARGVKASSLL